MNGNIVLNVVNHFNDDSVTFSCYDSRTRKLSIDSYNALCLTKSCNILQFDLQKGKWKKITLSKCKLISKLLNRMHFLSQIKKIMIMKCNAIHIHQTCNALLF